MAVLAKHCSHPGDFSQETVCVDLIVGQIDKQQYMLDSYHQSSFIWSVTRSYVPLSEIFTGYIHTSK